MIAFIHRLNETLGRAVSWLSLAMVLLMFVSVLLRYVFNFSTVWQQELVTALYAVLFLLAAGYTLKHDGHVRIDVLYQHFSPRKKAWVNILGVVLFLWPVCGALFYTSFDFVLSSWHLLEASPEYNGLYGIFLIKTCLWVFAVCVALQGLAVVGESLRDI